MKKEVKYKLKVGMKEVEIQYKISEPSFTVPPRPIHFLIHRTNVVLQASVGMKDFVSIV